MHADTALDGLILSLGTPLSVHQRLAILDALIEYWHGPTQAGQGFSVRELADRKLPVPLRWCYERYGLCQEILSGQNRLLGPGQLQPAEEGRVLFYVENQGVYLWSTEAAGDDPPVWGRFNEEGTPWVEEEVSLSEFLIQVCLTEAIFSAPYGASAAWTGQSTLDRIAAVVPPVPLGAWQWPTYPTRFYARNEVFMLAGPNGEIEGEQGYSVWVAAISRHPLTFLKEIVDQRWEYVAL